MADTTAELPTTSIGGRVKFDEVIPHCIWQRDHYDASARRAHSGRDAVQARRLAMNALTAEIVMVLFERVTPDEAKAAYRDAVNRIRKQVEE